MGMLVRKDKLTNDIDAIKSEYYKNKGQLDIGGNVEEAISNFFSLENTAIRLVAYKDVVNKCKRYANVPLYQFYVQMQKAEKQIYMVEKSSKRMRRLDKSEMVTLPGYKNPPKEEMAEEQYMCHKYCLKEKAAAEEAKKRQEEARKKREDAQKIDVLKKTGIGFDERLATKEGAKPEDGIVLNNRPDYTVPKDKWKLGN